MHLCPLLVIAISVATVSATAPNIDPAHSVISSELIGSLDWRPFDSDGASVNQYYCSGFIYGSAVGWINLGSGSPATGFQYRNDSAADFGVNVSPEGELTGFAYGANLGWINFVAAGNPRVDWVTGKLLGAAWSANAGWISLGDASTFLRIDSLPELPDSDADGLPDAWEIQLTGTLTSMAGHTDTDHDGQTNLQEYLAGTDPFDPGDFVGPLRLNVNPTVSTLSFPSKAGFLYRVEQRAAFGYGAWSPVSPAPIVGTGSLISIELGNNSGTPLFYRVVAYPPLTQLD
ncbi:MAG TPA: hypothetical protein VK633_07755 [Verrucomicrobiae bacterium]|nr:hypothetical protein [Verrucomicrobiae bacterium]